MSFAKFEGKQIAEGVDQATLNVYSSITETSDSVGLDPWGLRQRERADISIQELQKKLNTVITYQHEDSNIPKNVHFIWIGKCFTNPVFRKVIAEWAKNNPDYHIYLWYHSCVKNDVIALETAQWAAECSVQLMDIEKTLIGNMPILNTPHGNVSMDALYANEVVRRQYAGASDMLRLVIVNYFGGIYSDIDNRCVKPLGTIIARYGILYNYTSPYFYQQKELGYDFFNPTHYSKTESIATVNNNLFASTAQHPDLYTLMSDTCEHYLNSHATLFGTDRFNAPDHTGFKQNAYSYEDPHYKILPSQAINTARIIRLGPGTFHKLLVKKNIMNSFLPFFESNTDYSLPYNSFAFYQCYSWGAKEIIFSEDESVEMLIMHIVTILLNDLSREPRVLHLDSFAETINKNGIIDSIIEILFTRFEKDVAQLETVNLNNVWMTERSLNFLVNSKGIKTNYEVQIKDSFSQMEEISSYEEISKFMFLADRIPEPFIHNIFSHFFSRIMPKRYPCVAREELKEVCEFVRLNLPRHAEIFNKAYEACYGPCLDVIAYPEYANFLSEIGLVEESAKQKVVLTLYINLTLVSKRPRAFANEKLDTAFKNSTYALAEFSSDLLFNRTIEELTSHLIAKVKDTEMSELNNAKLIKLICHRWSVAELKLVNNSLLKLLLARKFLEIIPQNNFTHFSESSLNLRDLASTHKVEPLLACFEEADSIPRLISY